MERKKSNEPASNGAHSLQVRPTDLSFDDIIRRALMVKPDKPKKRSKAAETTVMPWKKKPKK